MNKRLIILAGIGVFLSILPFSLTVAQLNNNNIQRITVRIDAEGLSSDGKDIPLGGSGVIVHQQGQTYTIITARHVVDNSARNYIVKIFNGNISNQFDSYIIKHQDYHQKIRMINQVDMAEIKIHTSKKYKTATLDPNRKPQKDDRIYVAGYPFDNNRNYRNLKGNIIDITSYSDDYGTLQEVYFFDNLNTSSAMSGGPAVNEQGNIIGILIGAERDDRTGDKIVSVVIPINLYPQWQSLRRYSPSFSLEYLEELLSQKKWVQANDKTWEILIDEGDRNEDGVLDKDEVSNLNCTTLLNINNNWENYSQGKYGFREQLGYYQAAFYTGIFPSQESNLDNYKGFANQVGWYKNNRWLTVNEIYSQNSPQNGFFPVWFIYDQQWGTYPFGLPTQTPNLLLGDPYKRLDSLGTRLAEKLHSCIYK